MSQTEETIASSKSRARTGDGPISFDVWGCRGSKSHLPANSEIGNYTSCYSLLAGEHLFVFDGGLGLVPLSNALRFDRRFRAVKQISLLITHAHLDHWEGIKDADFFWVRGNNLDVTIFGVEEAISTIQRGFRHPSFVDLELLSNGTVGLQEYRMFAFGEQVKIGSWTFETMPLNHYSGTPWDKSVLQTAGYRLSRRGGPVVAYLSDHEPAPHTVEVETSLCRNAHLSVFDSHFDDIANQRYGHGSQEYTSGVARSRPDMMVLAGHHGPMYTDGEVFRTFDRHRAGAPNFGIAVEGDRYVWNEEKKRFSPSRGNRVVAHLARSRDAGRRG
jgi:phosphoribosyl 1,2-cyclic phosphodiesterase